MRRREAFNADLPIIARAHSEDEIAHLKKHGATLVVMGEHEIAKAMIEQSCRRPRGTDAGSKFHPTPDLAFVGCACMPALMGLEEIG